MREKNLIKLPKYIYAHTYTGKKTNVWSLCAGQKYSTKSTYFRNLYKHFQLSSVKGMLCVLPKILQYC